MDLYDFPYGTLGSPLPYPSNLTNVKGILFFSASDGVHGDQLWKSNGTATGTVMVSDINPVVDGTTYPYPQELTNLNGTLFFRADDGVHGPELWKSNGTAAGTVVVNGHRPLQ